MPLITSNPAVPDASRCVRTRSRRPASEVVLRGVRVVTSSPFDTVSAARALESAGVERTQAEAIASAIGHTGESGTKSDVSMLKGEIASLEARMYRALWIQGGAIVAILTALKLLE